MSINWKCSKPNSLDTFRIILPKITINRQSEDIYRKCHYDLHLCIHHIQICSSIAAPSAIHFSLAHILVPRSHDPSGLWQGSRTLAWSNTGSPRFMDFPSNLIGREYETNALRILRKSGLARALDPCHKPEGSWALGTRMISSCLNLYWAWPQYYNLIPFLQI